MRFRRFLLQDYNIFIQGSVRYVLLFGVKSVVGVKYSSCGVYKQPLHYSLRALIVVLYPRIALIYTYIVYLLIEVITGQIHTRIY